MSPGPRSGTPSASITPGSASPTTSSRRGPHARLQRLPPGSRLGAAPRIPVNGDPMMEEIFAAEGPVVVEDARTDPRTNKALVAQLGNRTIVNVPLRMLDKPLGAFGCGTFGDEGVRVPGVEQIEYLVSMCSQIAVAAARIRFAEHRRAAEREKHELETPPVPRPEAREPGPARRRHRARLRQPADGDPDQRQPGLGARRRIRWSARS